MEKKWWQYFHVCFELMSFLSYSKLQAVGMATSGRQLRFAPFPSPTGERDKTKGGQKQSFVLLLFKIDA